MIGYLPRLAVAALLLAPLGYGQRAAVYKAPRNPDGHADLQGLWEARNTASGNLEAHAAALGIRAGNSVIVDPPDGKIPYKPEALKKRDENFKNRATLDTVNKCFLPGVPRLMYMPYTFQLFQTPTQVSIASEYAHAIRNVYLNNHGHFEDAEFWMGDNRGKWDGDTLVIDTGNLNEGTWLDQSGNFHSPKLNVVERLTRIADDKLDYRATITDPEVFTRPWTIRMTLYRQTDANAQLFEYECHIYLGDEGKAAK
ncbi:MAG: hypothetical protein ABI824_10175 [Acidobacteriota bacterium]